MQNILVVHNYYLQRGGEDEVFESETKALRLAGLIIFKYSVHNRETQSKTIFGKIKMFFSMFNNRRVYKELLDIIKEKSISVVHFHNVFPLITPRVYRELKKYSNVKIVQTIHNYRFLCPNALLFRNNKVCYQCKGGKFFNCIRFKCYKNKLIYSVLYAYLIKKYSSDFKNLIDSYIVLTPFVKKLLIEGGFDSNRIMIKPNMSKYNEEKRLESGGYILFMGRLSSEKGIEFLLNAFSNQKKYHLVIAGTGPYENLVKEKTNDFITYKGFVSGQEKEDLITHAIAVVIPSIWYENYPIVLVDAFKFGVPVLASKIGGLPDIIQHKVNGYLFESESETELMSGVEFCTLEREKLGDGAKQTFMEDMHEDRAVERLISIYNFINLEIKLP